MLHPRLGRRRLAALVLLTLGGALSIVAFACGYDREGTQDPPAKPVDGSVILEASLPGSDGGQGPTDAPVLAPRGCPVGLGGPTMLEIPDTGTCIDSTEVTNADYDLFLVATNNGALDAGVPEGGLPAGCGAAVLGSFNRGGAPDDGGPRRPASRIPWCAAFGYCASVGKRLCGGPPPDAGASRGSGEWFVACSDGDDRRYPYGDAHVASACNDTGNKTLPVASLRCEGGVPGLHDMTGNVQEWLASCDEDAGTCNLAGGFFGSPANTADCPAVATLPRGNTAEGNGFRCCADLR